MFLLYEMSNVATNMCAANYRRPAWTKKDSWLQICALPTTADLHGRRRIRRRIEDSCLVRIICRRSCPSPSNSSSKIHRRHSSRSFLCPHAQHMWFWAQNESNYDDFRIEFKREPPHMLLMPGSVTPVKRPAANAHNTLSRSKFATQDDII